MKAKKQLGQNFLMHTATAQRIVKAAMLPAHSLVLEIGPGTGLLTRALLDAGHSVVAVETDRNLFERLREEFKSEKRLTLVHGDIRSFDFHSLKKPYAVVANIPYYITGEIIRLLLTAATKPSSITLLVQKEVAVRIARSKKESVLSLSVKAFGEPKVCFSVPRGAFRPAPKVDSAVLHISNIHTGFTAKDEEVRFFEVLHAGFSHKRKLLRRNLEQIAPPERIVSVFEELGMNLSSRAEDIHLPMWQELSKGL